MTPNAYLCAHCGHHEHKHTAGHCYDGFMMGYGPARTPCTCTGFTPGNCPTCASFGCADCFQGAKGRKR